MTKTNQEVFDAVLDVKSTVLDVKGEMVDLKLHVNHEVELLTARIDGQDKKIDGKLDNAQLLTSLGFKLFNNPAGRWTSGAVAFAAIATIASSHWLPYLSDVIRALTGYAS